MRGDTAFLGEDSMNDISTTHVVPGKCGIGTLDIDAMRPVLVLQVIVLTAHCWPPRPLEGRETLYVVSDNQAMPVLARGTNH